MKPLLGTTLRPYPTLRSLYFNIVLYIHVSGLVLQVRQPFHQGIHVHIVQTQTSTERLGCIVPSIGLLSTGRGSILVLPGHLSGQNGPARLAACYARGCAPLTFRKSHIQACISRCLPEARIAHGTARFSCSSISLVEGYFIMGPIRGGTWSG